MVVFTCNHCGESLQKPRVEKHYNFVCKRTKNLTCVDCLKDFLGEEYAVHTKCFTEDERYAAKGSLPNGIIKKGEQKQESWMEMIHSIINEEKNLMIPHRNLLNSLSNYNNVPRKKPKFINFVKNISGGRANIKDVEAVWDYIEKYKINNSVQTNGNSKDKDIANGAPKSDQNGHPSEAVNGKDEIVKSSKKKNKTKEEVDETEQGSTEIAPKKKRKKLDNSNTTESEEIQTDAKDPNEDVNDKDENVKSSKKKNKAKEEVAEMEDGNTEIPSKKRKKLENLNTMESEEIQADSKDLNKDVNDKDENVKSSKKKKKKNPDNLNTTESEEIQADTKDLNKTFNDKDENVKASKKKKKVKEEIEEGSTEIPSKKKKNVDTLNTTETEKIQADTKDSNETFNGKDESIKSSKKKKKNKEEVDETEEGNTEILPKKKKKNLDNLNRTESEEIQADHKDSGNKDETLPLQFDFETKILELVQSKGAISLKKLEKKIVKLYLKESETEDSPEKIAKKCNKKLKKMEQIQVEGDVVKLVI